MALPAGDAPFWHFGGADPRDVAVVGPAGEALTYSELDARIGEAAQALRRLGPRQLGFLVFRNDLPDLVAYLACLRAGHVPLLLARDAKPSHVEHLRTLYQPHWLMAGDPALGPLLSPGTLALQELRPREPAALDPQLALLLGTSGTTGSPKLVRLSAGALQANAQSIREYLALGPGERALTVLPPHYSYGLSVIHSHLAAGATLVLRDTSVLSPDFLRAARDYDVTSLSGVPYTYQMLHRTGFQQQVLPALRSLTQAGGRLDERLTRSFADWAAQRGLRFWVMYGQTEATARISYVPPEQLQAKVGSIGMPIPGGRLEVDEDGELVYHGANVMMGYAQERADLARGDDLGGVLRTGDLGCRDGDGFFHITGRRKRFLKLAGNRVSLDEVESFLERELQRPVAVAGADDRLAVFVEAPTEAALEPVRGLLAGEYGLHHSMVRAARLDRLPLHTGGKKDYSALAQPGRP
jgi:long-chain acyl-CoA synthetase